METSRTRPGNPDRGWNDPPMFNYEAAPQGTVPPRRLLNKRVAFPTSCVVGPTPGHAVLNPSQGPPILNPVLPADMQQGINVVRSPPPVPIGPRDTPLGNQAAPNSPVQLLPPLVDTSTPQTVPILVPLLVPSSPPKNEEQMAAPVLVHSERLEELMQRLSFDDDTQLLQHDMENFHQVLDKYRNILTLRVCDEIQKKLEIFEDRWKKGVLSEDVKVKISQLSIALLNEETDKANHLHLALMVDHIGEVNQWMMGVKRLLQHQLVNKEREIIAEEQQKKQSQDENRQPKSNDTSEKYVSESTESKNSEEVNSEIVDAVAHPCKTEEVTENVVESGETALQKKIVEGTVPEESVTEADGEMSCDKVGRISESDLVTDVNDAESTENNQFS